VGRVALRGLAAHKTRLITTLVAVALGVAFVGGVLTLTDTMDRTVQDLVADVYEDTDAVVRSTRTVGGGLESEEQRATVDAALLGQVEELDSVASAAGNVEGYARIIAPDGDPVGNPSFGPPTMGGNWVEDGALNPFDLRDGRAPEAADEIVMDAASAESAEVGVGDTVDVQTARSTESFEVVGIVGFGNVDSPGGANWVMFTTERAQELLAEPGRFNSIAAVAADGVSEGELAGDMSAALDGTEDVEVLTGTEITEATKSDVESTLSFVTNFFLVFAIVAVLVGSFVIYNSFAIVVAQRTREMALLRAIGASRRQVRRAVLVEAVVVGLVGSLAGYLLGLGIAQVLRGVMGIEGSLAILPASFAVAVAVGLVVTVASSIIPARRASKVPPVAAMREVSVDSSGRSLIRFALGMALLALGVGGVAVGGIEAEALTVGLGAGAAVLGLIVAGPGLARPVSAVLGWPVSRARGVTGSLARENAGRNPRRSASTAQALMIGVAIVGFFMVLNASFRASIDKVLDESFTGDLIVDSGTDGLVGLPHQVALDIAELDEVESVAPLRFGQADVAGDEEQITATSRDAFAMFEWELVDGTDALGPGEVVLLRETAEDDGLAVGDRIPVTWLETGPAELTVAGIYDAPPQAQFGSYIVGIDEMAANTLDTGDTEVMVGLADGVSIDQARPGVEAVTDAYPTAEVQDEDEFKDAIGGQLDQMLLLVMGLLVLAILIAFLGIGNTIALSVLERTRELGLLRAVGMSRRQLRSMVRWESGIIALLGTTLGLTIGLLGGWGMVRAFESEGIEVFQIPVGTLAVVSAAAALAGMAAAVLPAWRASRLDILRAIEHQ
jgi:putative ABC transport system permease protein